MDWTKRIEAVCVPAMVIWVVGAPMWGDLLGLSGMQFFVAWVAITIGAWIPEIVRAVRKYLLRVA